MVLFRLLLPRLHTAASHRRLSSSSAGAQSEVYTYALRYKRPITVPYRYNFRNRNSISLIGAIASPLKKFNTKNESFGVHTLLRVAGRVYPHFWVFVQFWGEIGKTAANYLEPNHLVFVQGRLNSWMRDDGNGNHTRSFSVIVSEFNFIAKHGRPASLQNLVKLEPEASAEDIAEMCRDRLLLWQLLFRNPHEWSDNRNNKKHAKEPDFRNKYTGEVLWIKANDPPWVKKQLELQDSRLGYAGGNKYNRLSLTPLTYGE